jgi:hypothetical protein
MAERERMDPTTIASAVCEKEFWPSGDARFWPLADIVRTRRSVRFRGQSGHRLITCVKDSRE